MSDWKPGVLADWLTFRNGGAGSYADVGPFPVFGANGAYARAADPNVATAGVVIGRVGSYCGSVHYSPTPAWVSENALVATPTVGSATRFWAYALSSIDLNSWRGGSGQPLLNQSILRSIPFSAPPVPEQQAIAEVLGALDDKIAANTALAERADDLMHSTFISLATTRELPLSSTADFVNGKAFTKEASGTGRVVVRIAELNGGISGSTVFSDAVVDDKHVARPGDILFAWSGSLTLHRWFRSEAIVNQHIFKVIPRSGFPDWLVYELVRQKLARFKAIAADKATTMGHIQRHHLDEIVSVPSPAEVERVNSLMRGLWDSALSAETESIALAATRDLLLPQLMSGKLRVRDAETIVSAAGTQMQ
ncbi:restriction endonuclease subunit S [Microbacterium aurum]|uniref:restriction endonuclease subunit S n=1 Tax=Microbacterium aurum TaxID=36805 RepID=UPI001EF5003F|nr:restriction endonuclease subunit S [Microbacterium aurum]MCG7413129.1 restriction endonuclease subunit S [Microbacterium aurum]